MTKTEIRQHIKNVIKNNTTLQSQSINICDQILLMPEYKNCQIILAYMALKDEVNLSQIILNSLKNNKQVALPRIITGTSLMNFYYIDKDCNPNDFAHNEQNFNIQEPCNDFKNLVHLDFLLNKKILVLVPGRAFTKDGKRLGRGKGFYDIYFSKIPQQIRSNVTLVGVCFKEQLLQFLPTNINDVVMDKVVFPK